MTIPKEINNFEDIIYSRDIIERIEWLECRISSKSYLFKGTKSDDVDPDEKDELETLKDLAKECEDYAVDWKYGETLIRDTYFKDYAMDFAEDIGAIDLNANWPTNCIDWDQAARDLQMDYTSVDFDGVDYWIR